MRPFRRGPGRLFPGPRRFRPMMAPAANAARAELVRANRLFETGHFAEAAEIFARMSDLAEQHGFPGRAANLSARAAHAFLEAGDVERGMQGARTALRLTAGMGNWPRAARLAQRVLGELEARGYSTEADELRREIDQHLAQHGLSLAQFKTEPVTPQPRQRLPAQCPACLGPVRPDEVEWADDSSAVCSYCGSILQAT